jgi:hypothetical protein
VTDQHQPGSANQSHTQNRPKARLALAVAGQTNAEVELAQLPPERLGAEAADGRDGLAALLRGPDGVFGGGSFENQAARLGDPRVTNVQRQALAAQIGRVQGNRHLQKVVASVAWAEKPASSKSICQQTPSNQAVQCPPIQHNGKPAHTSRKPGDAQLAVVRYFLSRGSQPGAIQRVDGGGGGGAGPAPAGAGGGGAPAPAPPAPASAEETIARAIALFMASAVSNTRLGRQVLRKLIELQGESEIEFEELEARPGYTTHAKAREGIRSWGRADVAVNEQYRRNVVRTSLELVHEAIHLIREQPYVDEEMAARNLQIDYYTELEGGIPFGRFRYQSARGSVPSLERQRQYRTRNQLVDYIINIPTYSESLEVEWVRTHIREWGNLSNRWRHTKGRYCQVLAEEPVGNAGLVLDILESETDSGGFHHVVNWIGGGDFNRGLVRVREAIRRGYALYSTSYYRRIEALQTTHHVNLGIPRRAPGGS